MEDFHDGNPDWDDENEMRETYEYISNEYCGENTSVTINEEESVIEISGSDTNIQIIKKGFIEYYVRGNSLGNEDIDERFTDIEGTRKFLKNLAIV